MLVAVPPGETEPDARDGRIVRACAPAEMRDADEILASGREECRQPLGLSDAAGKRECLEVPAVGEPRPARVSLEVPQAVDRGGEADQNLPLRVGRVELAADADVVRGPRRIHRDAGIDRTCPQPTCWPVAGSRDECHSFRQSRAAGDREREPPDDFPGADDSRRKASRAPPTARRERARPLRSGRRRGRRSPRTSGRRQPLLRPGQRAASAM